MNCTRSTQANLALLSLRLEGQLHPHGLDPLFIPSSATGPPF
jgi:hypothetical protein